ncbi:LysM peptidoglycan-binding domain-containing protein [Gammaproteobacteria bacterium]|nr:LysM peptidoglycan-binding domain-containing protein [Gammaproteobacteria bacterium]
MFQQLKSALISAFIICLLTGCQPWLDRVNHSLDSIYKNDCWSHMRLHFKLDSHINQPSVQAALKEYLSNKKALQGQLAQARPYLYYVLSQTIERGLPAEIALLPYVESHYTPFAYSRAGATGIWQMMPGTASGMKLKINWWYDERRDLYLGTQAALKYLVYLNNFFDGQSLLAIAAYDSGAGRVQKAVQAAPHNNRQFFNLKLPKETTYYIPRLLALREIVLHPQKYQVKLPAIAYKPYLEQINLAKPMPLEDAAKLTGISVEQLRQYNPGFRRFTSQPDRAFSLLIPISKVDHFKQQMSTYLWNQYDASAHHIYQVQPGDTLGKISEKFHTYVRVIQQANQMKDSYLKPGRILLIPKKVPQSDKKSHSISADHIPGPKLNYYTVRQGDTVTSIAKRFGVHPNDVAFWNNISTSKKLSPGTKYILWLVPKDTCRRVQPGDSLWTIAKRFKTTVKILKQQNNLTKDIVRSGQKICYRKP